MRDSWGDPFQKRFLHNTFVPKIENMEGSRRKLIIHGYGSIAYFLQTDDRSKVTMKVNNQPYFPNLQFHLLAPQQIVIDKNNNKLSDHDQTQMIINASSSVLLPDKRKITKMIIYRR